MKNQKNNLFFKEVAQQLIPYLLKNNTDNNDVDEMTYTLESNDETVIDWDEVKLEGETLAQEG